jgi:DNA-binding GntR family transcriptional regulator
MTKRASDRVEQELRRMIITGELEPGAMVSEAYLAKLLRCSRTPLRDGLHRMSGEYLVDVLPRRGIFIPELSIRDYQRLCEMRLLLAGPTVDFAVDRMTRHQMERLQEIPHQEERCDTNADYHGLVELDSRFHVLISEAAGNPYLVDATRRLQSKLSRFLYFAYATVGSAGVRTGEHRAIIESLGNRDGEEAKQKLISHISLGRQKVLNILGAGDLGEKL